LYTAVVSVQPERFKRRDGGNAVHDSDKDTSQLSSLWGSKRLFFTKK